MMQLTENGAPI